MLGYKGSNIGIFSMIKIRCQSRWNKALGLVARWVLEGRAGDLEAHRNLVITVKDYLDSK